MKTNYRLGSFRVFVANMTAVPKLRQEKDYYVFAPTPDAERVVKEVKKRIKETGKPRAQPHDLVHQKAVRVAKERGIHDPDMPTLRGLYEIQLGQYQGQTFRWLVENAMGYVTNLLCQIESEGGNTGAGHLNDNKRQLKVYNYLQMV